jgi:hypothetical protein
MPDHPSDESDLDPIDVEPTEDLYSARQPRDTSEAL